MPSRVDTTTFPRQISSRPVPDTRIRFHRWSRENVITPWNDLPLGDVDAGLEQGEVRQAFPGLDSTGWSPGDPSVAAGPNHIVQVTNVDLAFYSKTGEMQFRAPLKDFFTGIAQTTTFDPKVFFDHIENRWVVITLEQRHANSTSYILMAISDDADPHGVWTQYALSAHYTYNSYTYWLDYPGMGYNKDAYVFSGNMFGFSAFAPFNGVQFITVPKAAALSGEFLLSYRIRHQDGRSVQIAHTHSATQPTLYGAGRIGTSLFRLYAFQNLTGSPLMTITQFGTPPIDNVTRDAQTTSGKVLDSLDERMYNVSQRGNRLVAAHNAQRNGRIVCVWYEVAPNNWPSSLVDPTYIQGGVIELAGADAHMPAVAINGYGDIGMVFTRSSTSRTADLMFTGRRNSDTLGAMGTPVLLRSSPGDNPNSARWGDYFAITPDPVNDWTFWLNGAVISTDNRWTTEISGVDLTKPEIISLTGPSILKGGQTAKYQVAVNRSPLINPMRIDVSTNPPMTRAQDVVDIQPGQTGTSFWIRTKPVNGPTRFDLRVSVNGTSLVRPILLRP